MNDNCWGNPDAFSMVLRCTKMRYARTFLNCGQIKFSTPSSWVEYEEKYGDGRGDRLEGTMATFNIWDFENSLPILRKYSHYTDLLKIQNGNRIYLKRRRDMHLPCFCLYYLKNSMFICPKEPGIQKLKTSIPYSYFRDLADNMSPEEVQKLPEDERPVLIVIEDYPEFKRRLVHKLIEIGLLDREIIETKVSYFDFDQYGEFGWWDFGQKSPMELAVKHIRFKDQNEGRFIINTDNQRILQLLDKPIEIGPLDDICILCDHYLYDGMDIVMTAKVEQIDEQGSTFGTVFLDCPESRPLFYSQSLAIQGFCRDKLSVRIWILKSKQLKMAAEAVENRRSEPLFPETELLLFPKKCVLILLWRLKVQSGMRAYLIIKSNVLVNLLSQFSLGAVSTAVKLLFLKYGKEGFHHRVVMGRSRVGKRLRDL